MKCQISSYINVGDFEPFTRENQEFQKENQMVSAIPLGKLQKIWAVIWGDAIIFLLSLVCSAGLDTLYGRLFSHHVNFCSSIVMNKISNWVACVNHSKHS